MTSPISPVLPGKATASELLAELRRHEADYPSLVHGPLCGQAAARIQELEAALRFYADGRRYQGPNQSPIADVPYAKRDAAYIMDVTRDNGSIANRALTSQGNAK